MPPAHTIIPYENRHRDAVIELWSSIFGYESPHNDPALVIDKKAAAVDGLFYVAETGDDGLVGTVMCGYDGHRGWIYSLAVSPRCRRMGMGKALVEHAERALADLGCVKINLQVIDGNDGAEEFYHRCGYATEKRISMGKKLPQNFKAQ